MASESEPLLPTGASPETVSRTLRKLDSRVLALAVCPILFCCVDRMNIGFVARDLCKELEMNHRQYGLGAGLFFGVGYIPVQFFGNRLLKRFGAPTWLAFIMCAWSCASSSMSLVRTPTQLYVLRFLLGLAEGGTFPGVFYYLSSFYPPQHQTGPYSIVMAATSLAMPLASPISAGLLAMDGLFGIEGWRYVFVGEGLMSIVCAGAVFVALPESLEKAAFLEPGQRQWLLEELSRKTPDSEQSYVDDLKCAVRNKTWWLISIGGFLLLGVSTVLALWVVLIIHDSLYGEDEDDDDDDETCGSKNGNATTAVLLTSIPYVLSSAACFGLHWFDNAVGIRNRPRFSCVITCFSGLAMMSWIGAREVSFATGFVSLVVAIGTQSMSGGCNIGLIMSQFDSNTGATCIGIGNIIYSFGPLIFPPVVGAMVDSNGYTLPMLCLGSATFLSGVLAAFASDPLTEGSTSSDEDEKH